MSYVETLPRDLRKLVKKHRKDSPDIKVFKYLLNLLWEDEDLEIEGKIIDHYLEFMQQYDEDASIDFEGRKAIINFHFDGDLPDAIFLELIDSYGIGGRHQNDISETVMPMNETFEALGSDIRLFLNENCTERAYAAFQLVRVKIIGDIEF
jgi:hypothetical protein